MKEGHPVHRRVGSSRAPASQNPVHTRGGYQCVPILELRVPSSWACLGTSCWEPLLGNLLLGTSWEPVPGNLAWKPTLLGNLFLGTQFPTLRRADLAAPRDSLGKGNPSWEPGSQPCAPCGFGCPDLLRNLYYG